MENQKTLILIDGHALAFRQYYALERTNMQTSDGTPTWAVYGFFKAIFDLLKNKKLQPDAICVAFDVSHHTFRVDEYAEYKANREAMPDNMQIQMGLIYEGLEAFNIPIYTKEGYEADDVIGTISKKACALGHKVYILTGDQDSFQLIDKEACTSVIIPTKGVLVHYDWEKVHEKLGVYPDQIIDYKSLRGDTSDNIPGVKGIGEKTAVKLLEEYGHLDNVLQNCDSIKPDGVRQKICDSVDMAKLSYKLATIVCDVDVNFDFEGTKVVLPDISKATDFLKKLQFYSFLKNIDEILKSFDKYERPVETPVVAQPEAVNTDSNGQLGLFAQAVQQEVNKVEFKCQKNIVDSLDKLKDVCDKLLQKPLISFNLTESDGTVWLVLSYNDGFKSLDSCDIDASETVSYCVNLSLNDAIDVLKPLFENEKVLKVTHDAKAEYSLLKRYGIELKGVTFDTLLASYVEDASRNHNIDVQAIECLNYVMDAAVGKSIDADYMFDMASVTMNLTKFWLSKLDEKELKLLINVEIPLAFVLARMELLGVSVDVAYLKALV